MKSNIEMKDFLKMSFISGLTANRKGNCAYIKHTCSEEEKPHYEHNIYIDQIPYTSHGKASLFLLEEDDLLYVDASAYEENRKETQTFTSFYRMPIHGGASSKAFEIPYVVSHIQQYADHLYVLVCQCRKDEFEGDVDKKRIEHQKVREDKEVFEEIPFYFNGAGYADETRSVLFIYDERTHELTKISDLHENVECTTFDQKEGKIYYSSCWIDKKHALDSNLYVYDIDSKQSTLLCNQGYSIYDLFMTSYGLLIMGSDRMHYGINENPQFYVYDGENITLFAASDMGIGSSVGNDCRLGGSKFLHYCDDVFYFIATIEDHASIYALYADKTIKCIYDTNGSVDGIHVENQQLFFILTAANGLQEVYVMDLETSKVTPLTSFNQAYLESKKVVNVERCDFENDGLSFKGWVLKPVDFDPNKKYPGILEIHGGPKTVFGNLYHHEMQLLANQGYFVFYTNPRGSDGRGNEFADIRGKYGTIDYDDLMCFVDKVLATYPQIDAKRLGVCGGSYGGFMTNWIIGHTNRFAAAVSQRSIANWISFYNTSDIGEVFGEDQCAGNPWDNYEKLWNHSPLKYARNVTTPTLIIHADEDYRCPLSEGLQMYSAIAMNKVPSRMAIFKHENHDLSRSGTISRRIKRLEELVGWMNQYLKEGAE